MKQQRINAMAWWNHDLCKSEKEDASQDIFKKSHHTLTGSEIEKLWKLYNRTNKIKQLWILLN